MVDALVSAAQMWREIILVQPFSILNAWHIWLVTLSAEDLVIEYLRFLDWSESFHEEESAQLSH